LTGRPSKKHGQDPYCLSITHLCCKFGGITADQHAEAVKWQSRLGIQGIISAAGSIYISAPIADLAKEHAQDTVFLRLAFVTGNRSNNDIFFTCAQEQDRKKSAQTKDPANEFFLKFVEVQRAAVNDPLNDIINNIKNLFPNIINRRG
jgi:hypothetical protein